MNSTTVAPAPGVRRMGYQPGLDGLRALSVVLVILYHAGIAVRAESPPGTEHRWFFDGGFLGVEVFFVVSGFLITSLLLEERSDRGRINLPFFWLRRFRRLLPALWLMIVACAVWATFWGADYLADLKWDSVFGLFYGANFQQLFSKVSYFGGFPHLLRHLWSLAVEEHFYLFFPPLFALVLRRSSTPARRLLAVVVPLAVASALAFVLMWAHPVERLTDAGARLDDSRQNWAYLSTFTRMGGILIGCCLAPLWSPWKRATDHRDILDELADRRAGRRIDLAGVAAVALIVVAAVVLTTHSAALYRGGLTVVSLLAAVAIAAAVDPRARVMRVLFGARAMAAVGRRSYGLYIWHWPIFVGPCNGMPLGQRLLVGGAATIVVSELCYRYVETPIRKGALARWFRGLDRSWAQRRKRVRFAVPTVLCVAGFSLLVGALVVRLSTVERTGPLAAAAGPAEQFDESAILLAANSGTVARRAPTTAAGPAPLVPPPIPPAVELPPLPRHVVIVGDSMANSLYHNLPDGLSGTFAVTNGSLEGCGVYDEGKLRTELPGYSLGFQRCRGWQQKWAEKTRAAGTEVALVVLGAWDVFDMEVDDRRLAFGSPEFDTYWSASLASGLDALRSAGAKVALLEVGCMRPQNVKGQGTPALPERGDDDRAAHLNQLLIKAAIADPTNVFFVPGPTQWCTDEAIARDLYYRWDGVHASRKGGKLIMESIAPELLSIPVDPGGVVAPATTTVVAPATTAEGGPLSPPDRRCRATCPD